MPKYVERFGLIEIISVSDVGHMMGVEPLGTQAPDKQTMASGKKEDILEFFVLVNHLNTMLIGCFITGTANRCEMPIGIHDGLRCRNAARNRRMSI